MRTGDKKTCGNVEEKGNKKTTTSFEEERKKYYFWRASFFFFTISARYLNLAMKCLLIFNEILRAIV